MTVRPAAATPELDDVTEPIPIITAPRNLRPAPMPASLTKAEPAAPPASQTASGLATRPAVVGPPASAPGTGGSGTSAAWRHATEPAISSGPALAEVTTARPAGSGSATAAVIGLPAPKQRRVRRARKGRGAANLGLPEELMMRPLFVEETTFEEVLATVRAESAGITPRSGMWPAAIVVAVATLMILILAVGIMLALAG